MDKKNVIVEALKEEIETGVGGSAYKKHVNATEYLEVEILKAKKERDDVTKEVSRRIDKMERMHQSIRKEIQDAIEDDDAVKVSEAGTRKVYVDEVATISLSKEMETIIITDPEQVMKELGKEFVQVKKSLDVRKAKGFLSSRGKPEDTDGVEIRKSRKLTIRLK